MLSVCAFPKQTKHSPYSCFLGVCIHLWSFSSSFCLVLYSTISLFFSPPSLSLLYFLFFFFFLPRHYTRFLPMSHVSQCSYRTSPSSSVKLPDWLTKHRLASVRSRVKSCLHVRLNVCICRVKCLCLSDFVTVCVCVGFVCVSTWGRVENSKSPRIGPETVAPTHYNLFNLDVPLIFPFQSYFSCIFCACLFQSHTAGISHLHLVNHSKSKSHSA